MGSSIFRIYEKLFNKQKVEIQGRKTVLIHGEKLYQALGRVQQFSPCFLTYLRTIYFYLLKIEHFAILLTPISRFLVK